MKNMINKYEELLEALEVGKVYRYIGDGEFEIVDLKKLINDAIAQATYGGKLP